MSGGPAVALEQLFQLMATLRAPGGCPWDAAQTHASLLPYLLEETYEAADAVEAGDMRALAEELGDLLVEVAMQTAIAAEAGAFDLEEVATAAAGKMVSRHPHVFGGAQPADEGELLRSWEHLKRQEKPERTSALDGVPSSLPALLLAASVQRRAARGVSGSAGLGADGGPAAQLAERLASLAPGDELAGEVAGRLLWAVVAECSRLGCNPELALRSEAQRRSRLYRQSELERG